MRCPLDPNQQPTLSIALLNHEFLYPLLPRKSGHQNIQCISPYLKNKDTDKIPTALGHFHLISLSYTPKIYVNSDVFHRVSFITWGISYVHYLNNFWILEAYWRRPSRLRQYQHGVVVPPCFDSNPRKTSRMNINWIFVHSTTLA